MTRKSQNRTESNHLVLWNDGDVYEIKIREYLDDHWQQWFEGMVLKHIENSEIGQACTFITGPVADQPALHGLLAKVRDLNLTLISVRKIDLDHLASQEGEQSAEQKDRGGCQASSHRHLL